MDKDLMSVATQIAGDLIRSRTGTGTPLDEQAVADIFLAAYRGIKLASQVIAVDEAREAEQAAKTAEIAAARAEAEAAAAWIAAGGILDEAPPAQDSAEGADGRA